MSYSSGASRNCSYDDRPKRGRIKAPRWRLSRSLVTGLHGMTSWDGGRKVPVVRWLDERVAACWPARRTTLDLTGADRRDALVLEEGAYALDVREHAVVLGVAPRERLGGGGVAAVLIEGLVDVLDTAAMKVADVHRLGPHPALLADAPPEALVEEQAARDGDGLACAETPSRAVSGARRVVPSAARPKAMTVGSKAGGKHRRVGSFTTGVAGGGEGRTGAQRLDGRAEAAVNDEGVDVSEEDPKVGGIDLEQLATRIEGRDLLLQPRANTAWLPPLADLSVVRRRCQYSTHGLSYPHPLSESLIMLVLSCRGVVTC